MKLALALFAYFPHGGLQRDCRRIADEAYRRGHEVELFTTAWQGEAPEFPVRILAAPGRSNHARMAAFGRAFFAAAPSDAVTLTFNRIGAGDFHFAGDRCFALNLRRFHPVLWPLLRHLPRYRSFGALEKAIFAPDSPTRIFSIVHGQQVEFQEFYGTPEARFIPLPPGLDERCRRTSEFAALRARRRAELGIAPDELVLLEIGSEFFGKGMDRLLGAAAVLPKVLRRRVVVLLVGALSPEHVRRAARRVGFAGRLLLPGVSSDVAAELSAADLTVHPARNEAAGSALIESLVSGVPVVCSDACGFAPFVADSGGAVLHEPFGPAELSAELAWSLIPENLAELTRRAVAYGAQADFYRRAAAAVDALEAACHA